MTEALAKAVAATEAFKRHIRLMELAGKAWAEISREAEAEADRLHREVLAAMKEAETNQTKGK